MTGLSEEEVKKRIEEGKINKIDDTHTKTTKEIIKNNTITYFNILNIVLCGLIIFVGIFSGKFLNSIKNATFIGVAFFNTIISIVQEIKAKKIIDQLSVINNKKVIVIRDNSEKEVDVEEVVLGDLVKLSIGSQVVCDAKIVKGNVEVNESFITGESKTIAKKNDDDLLSGSFITSGECLATIVNVGKDNYINKIMADAKKEEVNHSLIFNSFEKLVRVLSYILVPLGIILFVNQYYFVKVDLSSSIINTVAALIGMIPEGLVLLTSSVMAVSVVKLSKYKVLIQQLYCIETLARVNVICLDKTGTITTGNMKVNKVVEKDKDFNNALIDVVNAIPDNSSTFNALKAFVDEKEVVASEVLPFSSSRKYSACIINGTTYFIGAPEYILGKSKISDEVKDYQNEYRVMLLASSKNGFDNKDHLKELGYILIEDEIRNDAKETLDYFKKEGVKVKIISGDNYRTVKSIGEKVGLKNLVGVDCTDITVEELKKVIDKTDVFGRVTPDMKKVIIMSLKEAGNVVAMTGDGVNDVLALKESDCAITVASGTDAAKNVSQLVLLNNDFSSMPQIVVEGRQTINNIERSASLLLTKTVYTILLIFTSIFFQSQYFFIPIQLTLITFTTIGTPSFILALEPNHDLVDSESFLKKILRKALPGGLTVFFNVIIILLFQKYFNLGESELNTLAVLLTGVTGFINLYHISKPFNILRTVLYIFLLIVFLTGILYLNDFFNIASYNAQIGLLLFLLTIFSLNSYKWVNNALDGFMKVFRKLRKEKVNVRN